MSRAKVKVEIANKQKKLKIPRGVRLLVKKCCNAVLINEQMHEPYEVNVTFIDNKEIRDLNHAYRGKDMATDVLSFPLGEDDVYDKNHLTGNFQLGDIVISAEKAYEQAETYGHSFEREVGFLTVHSMLHLLGYDHEVDKLEANLMREKEEEVLNAVGLNRLTSHFKKEH